jgi:putative aldouronate transport system substrate-binding protein
MQVGNVFASAYGVTMSDFYRTEGKVRFGPYEPSFLDYLTTLRKWYAEDLLDKDFSIHSPSENVPSMLMAGKSAAAVLHLETVNKFQKSVTDQNPEVKLIPAPYPKLNKGDRIRLLDTYYGLDNQGIFISAKCPYPKEATMMIDALYLEENCTMFALGKEGETYEIDSDGNYIIPTPDPNAPAKPNLWSLPQMIGIGNKIINELQYQLPEQHAAWDLWSRESREDKMPGGMLFREEESARRAQIMTDVNTYVDEQFVKFIMGIESLDKFDAYRQTLKDMGIEDAIGIYQGVLDRYNNRK